MQGLDIAYMHAKFDHSSFSRSIDMVGVHQNSGFIQTLESPRILLFRIPGPGKSWKKA